MPYALFPKGRIDVVVYRTWLYDASSDYSKDTKELNSSMLAAMSLKTTTYNDTPDAVVSHGYKSSEKSNVDKHYNNRFNSNSKVSKIAQEYMWLIK